MDDWLKEWVNRTKVKNVGKQIKVIGWSFYVYFYESYKTFIPEDGVNAENVCKYICCCYIFCLQELYHISYTDQCIRRNAVVYGKITISHYVKGQTYVREKSWKELNIKCRTWRMS